MNEPRHAPAARRRLARWPLAAALTAILALAACEAIPSVTPSPATPGVTAGPSPTELPTPTDTLEPTATPEPELSLELPPEGDRHRVQVAAAPDVAADGDGRIVVTVENLSDQRIRELVLRWPTELREILFLAPFEPSQQRIADGGPPLWQEWTKWVDGPGERGEPAGTTSLGWGPLDPGATLTIPILVTRRAPGHVAFDLQVLAGEAILTLPGNDPAELRVQVP